MGNPATVAARRPCCKYEYRDVDMEPLPTVLGRLTEGNSITRGCPMERRNFLFTLCGVGAAGVLLTPAIAGKSTGRVGRCKIVNETNRTIYLKIVGSIPGLDSHPPRGGVLFPEEEYRDELGE